MSGKVKIVKFEGQYFFEVNSDYETELMISRLVPSHMDFPLRVRVQPENTRIIRMIMNEFGLELDSSKELWNMAIRQIEQQKQLAESVEKLDYVEPNKAYFNGELLPFQKQALDFLQKTDGKTLITDEMGLGKTIETLAFVAQHPEKMPVVVVAPLVTLINWKREIEKFLTVELTPPGNQKTLLQGKRPPLVTMIRSGKKKDMIKPADFYLINYELVGKRLVDLLKLNPKIIVYDEIHSLRNNDTVKYAACVKLSLADTVEHVIGLSGTPIYNRGIEMYNVCELIKPGILGDRQEFIRRYCYNYTQDQTTDESKQGLAAVLRKSIMIRRKKMDVLDDLPNKIQMRQPIPIDTRLYEMELEKLYERIQVAREDLTKLEPNQQKEGLFELNSRIRELRVKERQIAGLAKAPHVVEYLTSLLEDYEEEKFVIFCHHRNVHRVIYDGLWRYNPVQVIGGQKDSERQDAIDSFQNEKDTRAIICGLRAGNVGINLTSSAYVIFAELDWTPSVHRQAEDRLHRIGQKRKVFSHYLEGIGTFDEIISQVLLKKTVEISGALGDKVEHVDNKKAVEFLESKFNFKKDSKIAELLKQ